MPGIRFCTRGSSFSSFISYTVISRLEREKPVWYIARVSSIERGRLTTVLDLKPGLVYFSGLAVQFAEVLYLLDYSVIYSHLVI